MWNIFSAKYFSGLVNFKGLRKGWEATFKIIKEVFIFFYFVQKSTDWSHTKK